MRLVIILLFMAVILVCGLIGIFFPAFFWIFIVIIPLFCLGIYDTIQTRHTILRNFPIIGHFRFLFELIRPEIHQYLVESDLDGRPLSRERRAIVYERAKKNN